MSSNLVKSFQVPKEVRDIPTMCPDEVRLYDDHIECVGGQNNVIYFKDYTGVDMVAASIFCGFAAIRFLNSNNPGPAYNGATIILDNNRINFSSGGFRYAPANQFTKLLFDEVKKQFEKYRSDVAKGAEREKSVGKLEDIKTLKELLDIGAITQNEFEKKKSDILGL